MCECVGEHIRTVAIKWGSAKGRVIVWGRRYCGAPVSERYETLRWAGSVDALTVVAQLWCFTLTFLSLPPSQMFGNWTFGTLVFTVLVFTVTLKVRVGTDLLH